MTCCIYSINCDIVSVYLVINSHGLYNTTTVHPTNRNRVIENNAVYNYKSRNGDGNKFASESSIQCSSSYNGTTSEDDHPTTIPAEGPN